MQRTATQIMFPDAGDPNIPSLKKSNVTITGAIHNVYLARQQLVVSQQLCTLWTKLNLLHRGIHDVIADCVFTFSIRISRQNWTKQSFVAQDFTLPFNSQFFLSSQGSLPLVLMFDLPEDSVSASVDTEKISQLMQSLDVFINIRHKPKQSTLSVIIKGIERNAGNIYEARKQLLGLDEPRVHAEIPATYHIPNAGSIFQGNPNNNNDVSGEYFEIDQEKARYYQFN